MALNKLKFNSLNVTPTAGKAVGFNSSANGLEATFSGGAMTFIKKLTASSSSTLSFVDGSSDVVLDNTYKEYIFIFNNIHQATDQAYFQFNFSVDSGSNYNVTKTTTMFDAFHREDDATPELVYVSSADLAQSTNFANLSILTGNGDDESQSGTLHLFNPSSTTFVKHFISDLQCHYRTGLPASVNYKGAGYGNTTSAVDAIQFKMSSGNIDAGTITLYGIN
jgi:hypothetical protein